MKALEDVDLETVKQVFRNLKGADERDRFIRTLLESLPRTSVRDIVGHAQSVDFRFDIIGNLPVEILFLIFHHLEIYQAFQLRRVSKWWQKILSAPALIDSLLRPWDALGEVHLRMPPSTPIDEALALKAEHLDAFRTGNPFSMAQGEWEIAACKGAYPLNVSYNHGRLAWLDRSYRQLNIRHLEGGQNEISYTTPHRARIDLLGLSGDIAAVTTFSGKCYAIDLTDGSTAASITLPSASANYLAVAGKTLAVVQGDRTKINQHHVTIWSLDDRQTRYFDITSRDSALGDRYVLSLATARESIVILERVKGPPDEIFFTCYTFDGKIKAEGSSGLIDRTFRSGYEYFIVLPEPESEETMNREVLDPAIPSFLEDRDKEEYQTLHKAVTEGTCGIVWIVFDPRNNRFQVSQKPAVSCREFEIGQSDDNYWYLWKRMAFRFCEQPNGNPLSAALDLQDRTLVPQFRQRLNHGPWTTAGTGWPTKRSRGPSYDGSLGLKPIWILGDETYMIRVYPRGYTAFCFDKNVNMANEDEEFRRDRRKVKSDQARSQVGQSEHREKTMADMEAELVEYERRFSMRLDAANNGEDEQEHDGDRAGHSESNAQSSDTMNTS
ncbi:MAG: hypothetical protein Q9169_000719 [Polycauliona sp. 2 TL-2023]